MITLGDHKSGAVFDNAKRYRLRLWRSWDAALPRVLFILLNPSTADDIENDPTVERQEQRVLSWGRMGLFPVDDQRRSKRQFGSIEVVNAFAWRSTFPRDLYLAEAPTEFDPVGEGNDEVIAESAKCTVAGRGLVICGWGQHASKLPSHVRGFEKFPSRHKFLCGLLSQAIGDQATAFKLNDDGTPTHPLYLGYNMKPRRWADGKLHEEAI